MYSPIVEKADHDFLMAMLNGNLNINDIAYVVFDCDDFSELVTISKNRYSKNEIQFKGGSKITITFYSSDNKEIIYQYFDFTHVSDECTIDMKLNEVVKIS